SCQRPVVSVSVSDVRFGFSLFTVRTKGPKSCSRSEPLAKLAGMPTDTDTDTDNCLSCWALLVIDNEPIRRQLEWELQTVRDAIEGCEQEMARHEALDLPAFRQ